MEPGATRSGTIRFGVFEADLESGELRKNGRKIRLQDQPFRVLTLLLERPGEVVTREELRQQLWGGDTFVDFDHSLNMAVKKIRGVLGDSASTPRYVETLPKRGYRFIAPVEGVGVPVDVTEPVGASRAGWYVAAALLAVVLGAVVWLGGRWSEPAPAALKEVPFATNRGWEVLPAISPDGTRVAFSADLDGNGQDIYVKQVGDDSPLRLTDHPASEGSATWSPDGTRIAFVRQLEQRAIFEVSVLGGSERKIADLPYFPKYQLFRWGILSWSPDERFLATTYLSAPEEPIRVFILSLKTGELWPAAPPPEPGSLAWEVFPSFSPDGGSLAFARFRRGASGAHILVIEIASDGTTKGQPRQVVEVGGFIRGLDWYPDGKSIVFATTPPGTHSPELLRVSTSGGDSERLEVGTRNAQNPSIARWGNRLVYEQQRKVADIWRGPGPLAEPGRKKDPPERWISSTWQDGAADYSPDGTKIAFLSNRTGSGEIWTCNSDGSNEARLTFIGGGAPRWSPDGKWIAFMSPRDGVSNIFVVPAEGGTPRPVTSGPEFDAMPSWSRDGRWIYYQSFPEKDGWWIYKTPFDGGKRERVTQNRATVALESWDGRDLYFSDEGGDNPGIWKVPVGGGEEVLTIERRETRFWTVLKTGLCIRNRETEPHTLEFYPFDTDNFEAVSDLPENATGSLAVSPDGRHVLYSREELNEVDLMLVENFR